MDQTFWLGIAIGFILSVIASLVANFWYARIVSYLDSRRLLSHERRKARAKALHAIILELKEGRRDRHLYLLRIAIGAIVSGVGSIFCGVGVLVLFGIKLDESDFLTVLPRREHLVVLIVSVFLMFLGSLLNYTFLISMRRFRSITNALDNFTKYSNEYRNIVEARDA